MFITEYRLKVMHMKSIECIKIFKEKGLNIS